MAPFQGPAYREATRTRTQASPGARTYTRGPCSARQRATNFTALVPCALCQPPTLALLCLPPVPARQRLCTFKCPRAPAFTSAHTHVRRTPTSAHAAPTRSSTPRPAAHRPTHPQCTCQRPAAQCPRRPPAPAPASSALQPASAPLTQRPCVRALVPAQPLHAPAMPCHPLLPLRPDHRLLQTCLLGKSEEK